MNPMKKTGYKKGREGANRSRSDQQSLSLNHPLRRSRSLSSLGENEAAPSTSSLRAPLTPDPLSLVGRERFEKEVENEKAREKSGAQTNSDSNASASNDTLSADEKVSVPAETGQESSTPTRRIVNAELPQGLIVCLQSLTKMLLSEPPAPNTEGLKFQGDWKSSATPVVIIHQQFAANLGTPSSTTPTQTEARPQDAGAGTSSGSWTARESNKKRKKEDRNDLPKGEQGTGPPQATPKNTDPGTSGSQPAGESDNKRKREESGMSATSEGNNNDAATPNKRMKQDQNRESGSGQASNEV